MMDYMFGHAIYFAVFIIALPAICILYAIFVSIPRTMVTRPCEKNKKGFKSQSIYIWLPFYCFFMISTSLEIGYMLTMKGNTQFYPHFVWMECIGIPVCLLAGFIWAYCKGGFYKVKENTLYIKKYKSKEQAVAVLELKKYAQKIPLLYEKGEVKFYYREDWIIIPVSKCIGGYDFVNLLCDKIEVSRIYMEDI